MPRNKKQIRADHHDNVIRLKVKSESIIDEYKYTRDKIDQGILYIKTFRNRVVDMKINNYDKIIDLEIFLIKLFIPILGISFAARVNIAGIDTYTLKWLSLLIIIIALLLIAVTFIFRRRIVNSEQKRLEQELNLIDKVNINKMENLQIRLKQIGEDLKIALENEPNLQ